MKKYNIKLNSKEKDILKKRINNIRLTEKQKNKSKVILLKSENKDINAIMEETKLSKRTIQYYIREYIKDNNDFYKNKYINKSDLSKHVTLLKNEFKNKPPLTYKEATERVEKLTGIKRSETQIRNFLNKRKIYTIRSKAIGYIQKKSAIKKLREYTISEHFSTLINEFTNKPPLTYKEGIERIKKLIGLELNLIQIKEFLNKNDIYTSKSKPNISYNNEDFCDTGCNYDDFLDLRYKPNSYYPY